MGKFWSALKVIVGVIADVVTIYLFIMLFFS